MPVGRGGQFGEQLHPPVAGVAAAHGELQGGFALGAAEDGGAGEQAPAQGDQLTLGHPPDDEILCGPYTVAD